MTDKIEKIVFYENIDPLQKNWRCHIYTKDGSHYEGEGYTKEKAKENAMEVYDANKDE